MEHVHQLAATTLMALAQRRVGRSKSGWVVESVSPTPHARGKLVPTPRPNAPNASPPSSARVERCPRCQDAGYVRSDVPYGHPHFGKALPCACLQARQHSADLALLQEQSQLDALAALREATFETFDTCLPGVLAASAAAQHFADHPAGWLVLAGPTGCGKTHLAVSIAKQCLTAGTLVRFAVVPDLLDELRASCAPEARAHYDEAFTRLREVELLVLDDLGAERSSPWAMEKLYQLLNYRYNGQLPTVITTNSPGFEHLDERLRSRLGDRRLVRCVTMEEAEDYRMWEPEDGEHFL